MPQLLKRLALLAAGLAFIVTLFTMNATDYQFLCKMIVPTIEISYLTLILAYFVLWIKADKTTIANRPKDKLSKPEN
jgi:hypothetical protein